MVQVVTYKTAFITKFKSQFKQRFMKVVVIRAGRLQEWSQGGLQLYCRSKYNMMIIYDHCF